MIKWISDTIGYFESAVNIGLIKSEDGYVLIDTGIDNTAVNKVIKSLDGPIHGAVVTHHHADHMGGCSKLASLGIDKLYGPKEELELFVKPFLEPFTMFGGGYPPKTLRNRHLEAKPIESIKSHADAPFGTPIECPGHSPGHVAYQFDDVLFSGDAVFTSETIEKYNLLFAINPSQAAESLDVLEKHDFHAMMLAHGGIAEEKSAALDMIRSTRDHYVQTKDLVLSELKEGMDLKEIVPHLLRNFNLWDIVKERGYTQYILYQVPLMGYVSNLLDEKKLQIEIGETDVRISQIE